MLTKINYFTRKAYLKLARILVEKSVIPDEDLIFFFAKNEIMEIVKSKNPFYCNP